jgi:predicted DsbA family dithiol-disulfide isomerase
MTQPPIRIDIVSDIMCPWCIVGYRQLEEALQKSGTEAEIHWHPFELNPDMAPEGENMREHIVAKYGVSAEQSQAARSQLKTLGDSLGFTFSYDDDSRMWNTFAAHQLLHWAEAQGRAHDLEMALFEAHFTGGRNVSDHDTLADIAAEIGLDRDGALEVLADGRHAGEVRARQAFWHRQGISGVPAVVFDAQHLVTGAQGTDNYLRILDRVKELRADQSAGAAE